MGEKTKEKENGRGEAMRGREERRKKNKMRRMRGEVHRDSFWRKETSKRFLDLLGLREINGGDSVYERWMV